MAAEWSLTDHLSACCGPTVKVWSPGTPEAHSEFKINEGTPVYAIDWSTNNKVLAVAGDKSQVSMYSGNNIIGQVPNVVNPHIDTITCMRFSHSSKKMVIGCKNRTMHLLDLRQQVENSKSNVDHRGPLVSVTISPDDTVVASSSVGGQLVLHDYKTGSKLLSLTSDGPTKRAVHFSKADAALLAAALEDGGVAVWDVRTRQVKHQLLKLHRGGCTGVSFAPGSSSMVYTCGRDQRLVGLDLRRQQEAFNIPVAQPLSCITSRPDGVLVAAGTSSGGVLVFDVRSPGKPINTYKFSDNSAVHDLRWQHTPSSASSRRTSAVGTAAAGLAQQQQQQQQRPGTAQPGSRPGGAAVGARPSTAGPSPAAGRLPGHTGFGGPGPQQMQMGSADPGSRVDGYGPSSRPSSTPTLTPENSRGSDVFQNAGVSPVQNSESPGASASINTAASSVATPSDALGGGGGAGGMFMATPGYGVTRGLGSLGVDATPVSKYAADGAGLPARGPASTAATHGKSAAAASLTGFAAAGRAISAGGDPISASAGSTVPAAGPSGHSRSSSSHGGGVGASAAASQPAAGVAGPQGGMAPIAEDTTAGGSAVLSTLQPPSRANSTGINSRPASRVSAESSGADIVDSRAMHAASGAGDPSGHAVLSNGLQGGKGATTARDQQLMSNGGGPGGKAAAGGVAKGQGLTQQQQQQSGADAQLGQQQPQLGAAQQTQQLLREDVFTAYVDSQMQALRADIRALHVDMLKQFHHAQLDLASVVEGVVARQDALAQQVAELSQQLQQALERKADISLAWA